MFRFDGKQKTNSQPNSHQNNKENMRCDLPGNGRSQVFHTNISMCSIFHLGRSSSTPRGRRHNPPGLTSGEKIENLGG